MMIVVERSSQEPVYEQIARQIRRCVATGELTPGTPLPTVRTLASDLGVNLNTVARAYWLLEEEGFVGIRDRSGAEILAPPRRRSNDSDRLCQELSALLARMRQSGISTQELRRLFDREIAAFEHAAE